MKINQAKGNYVRNFGAGILVLIIFLVLIRLGIDSERGYLKVFIFDVGQGDAIFIITPGGQKILLDGGPDKTVLKKLGQILDFWERDLDYVILSHPHDDHLLGLVEVVSRYEVKKIIRNSASGGGAVDKYFKNITNNQEIIINEPKTIWLENKCRLDILSPGSENKNETDLNNRSQVIKLDCGGLKFLLAGDAGTKVEQKLIKSGLDLRADFIKISHHGSDSANSQEFLSKTGAKRAFISVGINNKFNHPSPRIINRLIGLGLAIHRTDIDGDIEILANNSKYLIKTRVLD